MAKWFRRRKKGAASESESTGKVGQAKDPKHAALQPSYLDNVSPSPPAAAPHPRRIQNETQPEPPTHPPAAPAAATAQPPVKSQRAPKRAVVPGNGRPRL